MKNIGAFLLFVGIVELAALLVTAKTPWYSSTRIVRATLIVLAYNIARHLR